jgi:hypothetical protein
MVGERSQWTPGRLAIIVFASNAAPKAQANHTQDIFFAYIQAISPSFCMDASIRMKNLKHLSPY